MNEKNLKKITTSELQIQYERGVYCVRVNDIHAFKPSFCDILKEREHNKVYLGIASKSLRNRFLGQELHATEQSTFFRSLAAIRGYLPAVAYLVNKVNKFNYRFSTSDDEAKIINWINNNLLINWVQVENG